MDEFHHAAARTCRSAVAKLKTSYLLGITATTFSRRQSRYLELCNNNVVIDSIFRFGIRFRRISSLSLLPGYFDEARLRRSSRTGWRVSIADLERRIFIPEQHQAIIEKSIERSGGKPTLAFCSSHEHAAPIVKAFKSRGIFRSVLPLCPRLPPKARQRHIEKGEPVRSGTLKILCVVDILNEGADIPFVECLLFLRPTKSKRIFLQQLGRGFDTMSGRATALLSTSLETSATLIRSYTTTSARISLREISTRVVSRSVRSILDLAAQLQSGI